MIEKCPNCNCNVLSHSVCLKCIICSCKYHAKCVNFNKDDIDNISSRLDQWMCPNCSGNAFPFNSLQDDDIFIESLYELNFGGSIDLNRIKDMVFNPFVLNENNNIPLFDTDPDTSHNINMVV